MTAPLRLGFLMTCYNDADVVGESIADVLGQTYPHCTLCVVNNGSTDESERVISALVRGDVRLPKNVNHGAALNAGAAQLFPLCDWLIVQNSDDRCAEDYAHAIVDAAEKQPDVNCIFSPWADLDGREIRRFPEYNPLTVASSHQIPGIRAVRRDLWELTNGEDPTIHVGSDWDWAVRASVEGWLKPYQLERPYVRLRERQNGRPSLSSQVDWPRLNQHMLRHRTGQWATWGFDSSNPWVAVAAGILQGLKEGGR